MALSVGCDFGITGQILIRASCVAAVVGQILTLINQWDAIFGSAEFNSMQLALTMLVPFCVSSISSYFASTKSAAEIARLNSEITGLKSERIIYQEDETFDISNSDSAASTSFDTTNENAVYKQPDTEKTVQTSSEKSLLSNTNGHLTNLNHAINKVGEIRNNAKNVNSSSLERVSFIETLITHAENVNANVGILGEKNHQSQSSITQVNSGIEEISQNVVDLSEDIAHSTDALQKMTKLTTEFQNQFVSVKTACKSIDELSSTIKMVSLNASIEAARNGEAGKGFSLIAKEIRELADRSKNDIEHIFDEMKIVEHSLGSLVSGIENTASNMAENFQTSQQFKDNALTLCNETKELSGRILDVSKVTAEQLPAVSGLIEDIKQIKANTEAAVSGSQTNITLYTQTLDNLGSILGTSPEQKKSAA